MDVDRILQQMNASAVDCILIGGMNFFLNHEPVSTFDVDLFIRDDQPNRAAANNALRKLSAEWGPTEHDWKPVSDNPDWLLKSPVLCLTSPHGAIDIFRQVKGLENDFDGCRQRAIKRSTTSGIAYLSLSDEDMLKCQLALPSRERKQDRVRTLEQSIKGRRSS